RRRGSGGTVSSTAVPLTVPPPPRRRAAGQARSDGGATSETASVSDAEETAPRHRTSDYSGSLSNLPEAGVDSLSSDMEEENRKNAAVSALDDAGSCRIEQCAPESKVDDSESDESTCEYDLIPTESESSATADTTRSDDSDSSDSETHVKRTYVLNASSSVEEMLDSGTDSPLTLLTQWKN
ncbi:dentin sialophosphoprotein-like, partial [Pollicipes pollicipes]|uniref:dentin sialophosphoprotein-like n=1 Tax=Pollicipes pollicipes TaxID=41117 RepID=UPI0018850AD8